MGQAPLSLFPFLFFSMKYSYPFSFFVIIHNNHRRTAALFLFLPVLRGQASSSLFRFRRRVERSPSLGGREAEPAPFRVVRGRWFVIFLPFFLCLRHHFFFLLSTFRRVMKTSFSRGFFSFFFILRDPPLFFGPSMCHDYGDPSSARHAFFLLVTSKETPPPHNPLFSLFFTSPQKQVMDTDSQFGRRPSAFPSFPPLPQGPVFSSFSSFSCRMRRQQYSA